MTEVRILDAGDEAVLLAVDPDVFDEDVRPDLARAFLADPRHHLAVAVDDGLVVGFASAVHYIHPDKPAELWVNEVGVAATHRGRGLGKRMLDSLFARGRVLGCGEAWVLTERANRAARALYRSMGGSEPAEDIVMYSFRLDPSPDRGAPGRERDGGGRR